VRCARAAGRGAGGEGLARNGRVVVAIGRVDCLDNRFVGYLTWIFRETRACLGADKRKCLSCKA